MIRFFRVFLAARSVVLFTSEFLLISTCFLLAGSILIEGFDLTLFLLYEQGLLRLAIVVLAIQLGLYFQDLYTQMRVRSRFALIQKLCRVMGIAFLLKGLLAYLNRMLVLPSLMMIGGAALSLCMLVVWRLIYSSVLWEGFGTERILFLGTNTAVEQIVRMISERTDLGISVVGYVDDNRPAGSLLEGFPVLGPARCLLQIVAQTKPQRIVIGVTDWREGLPVDALLELRLTGVGIESAGGLYEALCGRFCLSELRPSELIFSNVLSVRPGSLALQSIYTNLIGLAGLVLAAPMMLLIAAAIKLSSCGPVMAPQQRVGFNGIPFTLLRFRVSRADGTRTAVGRWLERWHLYALPQLLNVVRGEMALVGPRPERPEFAQVLSSVLPYYAQRHSVKPGMMGWSQIHGQYLDSVRDTMAGLEYDLYYIKNISIFLDIYIILRTLKAVFLSRDEARPSLRNATASAS